MFRAQFLQSTDFRKIKIPYSCLVILRMELLWLSSVEKEVSFSTCESSSNSPDSAAQRSVIEVCDYGGQEGLV